MPHILLTGAGFSRNWGGWLANEAFEFLLGCPEIDHRLRQMLWANKEKGGGFEDVLPLLQTSLDAEDNQRVGVFTDALVGMFNEMGQAFMMTPFEWQTDIARMVRTFLMRFDVIFTLNQDTLLELKYLDDNILLGSNGRWGGFQLPGTQSLHTPSIQGSVHDAIAVRSPNSERIIRPRLQPYFKLHGSCNWTGDAGRILILGGNKAVSIGQFPILSWYQEQFKQHLSCPGTRLMIIGYSFNDPHINDAIEAAVDTGNLELFIVDPLGVDVLDKRDPRAQIRQPKSEFDEKLAFRVIGASRRPLKEIFGDDVVELAKVMKFFVAA